MSVETELTAWMPHGIVFGAGGVRVVCQLGVYATLHDEGLTTHVTDWYGCSGGAICALFAALGVSSRWIRDCIAILDLQLIGKPAEDLVLDYMNTWGVNSGDKLVQFLGRFADTWEPGASAWTFADLARERPAARLHVIATNVTRCRQAVFNATNTPDMRILDAVRASCGIPLLFTPWRSAEGDLLCDGAIIESYPWSCVHEKDKTLVIINTEKDVRQFSTDHVFAPPVSLPEYLTRIFYTMRRGHVASLTPPKHWIAVNNRDVSIFDFGITREQREALFAEGEVAGRGWIAFMRARRAATTQNQRACDSHCTLSSDRLSPDRMSDSPESRNPVPPLYPSRDLQTPRSRDRRWSL